MTAVLWQLRTAYLQIKKEEAISIFVNFQIYRLKQVSDESTTNYFIIHGIHFGK